MTEEALKEEIKQLRETVALAHTFLDSLPQGWLGKTTGDIGVLNDFYIKSARVCGPHIRKGN